MGLVAVVVVDDFNSGFVDFSCGCGGGMMFDFFFFCSFDGCGGSNGGCCGYGLVVQCLIFFPYRFGGCGGGLVTMMVVWFFILFVGLVVSGGGGRGGCGCG